MGWLASLYLKLLKKMVIRNILTISREKLDLAEVDKVNKWFEENLPTVVIIAAARVGGIMANKNNPVDFLLDNLKIQNNLIEASFKNGVKKDSYFLEVAAFIQNMLINQSKKSIY